MNEAIRKALKDPSVQNMYKTMKDLGGLEFEINTDASGKWCASAVNLPGVITGGDKDDDKDSVIRDAIFTYFEIPREFALDALLKQENLLKRKSITATERHYLYQPVKSIKISGQKVLQ